MTKRNLLSLIFGNLLILITSSSQAHVAKSFAGKDLLVKVKSPSLFAQALGAMNESESPTKIEILSQDLQSGWVLVSTPSTRQTNELITALKQDPALESEILHVQPNYKIKLLDNPGLEALRARPDLAKITALLQPSLKMPADNPEIPLAPGAATGTDPLINSQWGMLDIGALSAWQKYQGSPEMVVAVIDTGVDYTHEDLLPNLWRNPKEIPGNGIDDDNNGYVDDVIGWDFVSNDNKPFDLAVDPLKLLAGGGNPGHGTHCAGNVAARGGNGKGISGVAPNVKIMALRFISDKGQGTTADAIKAIRYAVDNGAKITSNSWGSEGEDPADKQENLALREAIQYSQDKNVLFVAAAGNGHSGKGYDNDSDAKPSYPSSYPHDIILSVAAIDKHNVLGSFSNWGHVGVDIAAPGVAVFSTTVGGFYNDKVLDLASIEVFWDGTSMATPHVAGAAALYWSAHPELTALQVKEAVLRSAEPVAAYSQKLVSGGKLSLTNLMK